MDYITVKEAAAKWSSAERSVQNYCANDKIPGAKCIGGQWFIPKDAKPPLDRRTKLARHRGVMENYRFPVFLYSRFYGDPSELNPEEQCLLQAQILHFEGNHTQSLLLCHELLKSELSTYIMAGVYLTIGIDSFLLGLITEYEEVLKKLEEITEIQADYKEDYNLMTAALRFYIDWNSSGILKIQPSKLSAGAVWYYQTMIITISALSGNIIPIYLLKFWESELPFFEKEGMTPMLYLFLCGLGVLNDYERTIEEKEKFLNRGVELAVEHNWIPNLSRFYNFSPALLEKSIKKYGDACYRTLMQAHKTQLNNWNILHSKETGFDVIGTFSPKQMEMLLMVSYGFTNKEIAICTNIPVDEVKNKIKELMNISQTANKAGLRSYARTLFDSAFDNSVGKTHIKCLR